MNVWIGQRVKSLVDSVCGSVSDIGYSAFKVTWDDGQVGLFRLADGWTLLVPIEAMDAKP